MVQWRWIQLGTMRLWVQSLAPLSGSRIQHCHDLWCRLQTQFRSGIAVAVVQASGYSSSWTPSLGISICRGCSPKKTKRQKKNNEWRILLKKIKSRTTILSSNSISGNISEGDENTILKRYLHFHVYSSKIYNSQSMETNWVSTNGWMDKEDIVCGCVCVCVCVHICNGILFSYKKRIKYCHLWSSRRGAVVNESD